MEESLRDRFIRFRSRMYERLVALYFYANIHPRCECGYTRLWFWRPKEICGDRHDMILCRID